jgi:hypothetical protein
MLRLRVYLGEVNHGELVALDAHEPIVDPATFAAAQRTPKRATPRSPSASFPLRGTIRCAGCGFPMTGWNQPRTRADGRVDRVRVYRCVRQRTTGRCESRAVVSADAVEHLVRKQLEPMARRLAATVELPVEHERLTALQADLELVADRLRALGENLQAELDADVWQEMVMQANKRRRQLLAERDAILAGLGQSTSTLTWDDMGQDEQFEIMLRALDAVVVRRVHYRGEPTERRVALHEAGSISHLFPGPANDWRLQRLDPEAPGPIAGAA